MTVVGSNETSPNFTALQPSMLEKKSFYKPVKKILDRQELHKFLTSKICKEYLDFLQNLNESVKGKTNNSSVESNDIINSIVGQLKILDKLIDKHPPKMGQMRSGNIAFKDWYEEMAGMVEELHKQILPESKHEAIIELSAYWVESFGNKVRIDYGTGHETNFMAWLFCMDKLGIWDVEQRSAVVLNVFAFYIKLVRKIQKIYKLEPAGSQGSFSLDDYHSLPFLFGSSQLQNHATIKPSSILEKDIYTNQASDFMFLDMIKLINETKQGPFFEHSPILADAAKAINWDKVNKGMLKLYEEKVLKQFPIMQHFPIGSVFQY